MTTCLLGALGTTVNAQTTSKVYVAGVDVIGGGYWVNDGEGGITTEGASKDNYNVSYNNGTLTLNGAYIANCLDWGSGNYCAAIYAAGNLNIKLLGVNTVTGRDNTFSYGVFTTDGTLTISGSGTLNATAGTAQNYSFAIRCDNIIINGGTVIANGGSCSGNTLGILTSNNACITDGTVIATGGQTTGSNYPMSIGFSASEAIISGGSVTATGGNAYYKSTGIFIYQGITISGDAVVHATGSTATLPDDGSSYGIYTNTGKVPQIILLNGTLIAESDSAATTSALSRQPTCPTNYEWRISKDDSLSTKAYEWQADHTYVELRSVSDPVTDTPATLGGSSGDPDIISVTDAVTGVRVKGDYSGFFTVSYLTDKATGRANEFVDAATYKQLLNSVGSGYTVLNAYEVKADDYSGSLTLTFPVGEEHNGKEYIVLHKTSSGAIKTYTGTVSDGKIVITVSSLSPFMVAVKDGVRIPETGALGLFEYILSYLQSWVYTVLN